MAGTLRAKGTRTGGRTDEPAPSPDAARAWSCMTAFLRSTEHVDRFAEAARGLGLTLASMKALVTLAPGREIPMRELAGELHCDASNVTQLVDALEGRGFVERVPKPTDRRVKLLRVTERGTIARAEVLTVLSEPPDCLRALSGREQAELARLLSKALAAADPPLQPWF